MTTPAEGTATPAPTPTNPPVTPPPAAAAPANPNAAVPQPVDETQPWFKDRLARAAEQERQRVLDELGVKDSKKAKADLEAAEKAREEAKTVADKLTDQTSKLTRTESEVEKLRSITAEFATRQMMALSAEQQKAVKDIAGDDAAAQLKAITALAPTWAKSAQAATQTQAAPPASGTAPPPAAPDGTTVSQPNHREVHAALHKQNPFAAAAYAMEHLRDVFPEQPPQ